MQPILHPSNTDDLMKQHSILTARNIEKSFGNHTAIHKCSLHFSPGEITAVTGPSGAGKTTLLHLLAGLLQPDSGEIIFHDVILTSLPEPQRTIFRRRHTAFVFQEFNLLPNLTAEENILLPRLLEGISPALCKDKVTQLLTELGLLRQRKQFPDQLSGGERQRVAIARALMSDAEDSVLFADEPTGNLDSRTGEELCRHLRRLADEQKRTILIATHSPIVCEYCDIILRLHDGTLLSKGDNP